MSAVVICVVSGGLVAVVGALVASAVEAQARRAERREKYLETGDEPLT